MEAAISVDFRELYEDSQAQLASLQKAHESVLGSHDVLEKKCASQGTALLELKHQIDQLRRMIFGSRSERFIAQVPGQLSMDMEVEEVLASNITEVQQIEYLRGKVNQEPKQIKHPGRWPLPEHLRREEILIEPFGVPEGSPCVGYEYTEQLEYVPGELFVKRFKRPKYAVPAADGIGNTILIADLPVQPIEKCIAGPVLLTQLVVNKFVDSMPLYRQLAAFKRHGVEIPKSTCGDWIKATANLFMPLYDVLKSEVLNCNYINADETGLKVLDRDKKKTTHAGWFWVYLNQKDKLVFFDYHPSRGQEAPKSILQEYKGYLQVDGYSVYESIGRRSDITLLCCMAHVRRKFEESLKNDAKRASKALAWFQMLWAIEERCQLEGLNYDQIREVRQKEAVPILAEIFAWMKEEYYVKKSVTESSAIGKAMAYAMARWDKLCVYTTNGLLSLDNNCVERAIRIVSVGRKNWMFAGSHEAAQRSAMLYSLMGTCRLHDINPFVWMQDVLCRIHLTPKEYLHLLLPHNWKPRI